MNDQSQNQKFFNEIIQVLENSKLDPIERNFEVGRLINSYGKGYKGKNLIENLSEYLKENETYAKGYSFANLSNMQRFYKRFRNYPDLIEFARKLEWTKIVSLLKLGDIQETEYYLKFAIKNNWSREKLESEIEEETYEIFKDKVEKGDYQIKIKNIKINNFKSIVDLKIENPPRFLVFAGANSSGKSNLFESLDFLMHSFKIKGDEVFNLFGGKKNVINFNQQKKGNNNLQISLELSDNNVFSFEYQNGRLIKAESISKILNSRVNNSFSRLFVNNKKNKGNRLKASNKLWYDASNLNLILKTILSDDEKKEEILSWLTLFIPGLENIIIETDPLSGEQELVVLEKHINMPIKGNLISDGTYNAISLLTLLYQSDDPQFLCIEEPENGLNPKLLGQFVELFRNVCANEGHYIWLATHSQSIVSHLKPSELVIVDKIDGATTIKQFNDSDYKDITMDEAWLNNLLDGGLPW